MYQWKSHKTGNRKPDGKTEIKLFIFFFFVYSLFIHWAGWNEYSRLDLTRAIVDEGRFEIDAYQNNTGDSAYYKGHYYSDKAPGMSFLGAPVYFLAKQAFNDRYQPTYIAERVTFQKNAYTGYNLSKIENLTSFIATTTNLTPSELELNSMALITILTSVLFSSLSVVVIYRLSKFFLARENQRMLAVFAYGLGTLTFPYALVFFEHSTATFFALLSFYLLFAQKNKPDNKRLLLAGVCSGVGVTVSYVNILVLLPTLFYSALLYRKSLFRNLAVILAGLLAGLLPLIFYNLAVFGGPAETAYNYVAVSEKPIKILLFDPSGPETGKYERAVTLFDVKPLRLNAVAPRLLFMPYRGLFFYYPILLFSLIGLYQMRKRNKKEAVTVLLMFVFVLLFNTFYGVWWGGGSFGPRYMTVLMPFLMIPMFVAIGNMRSKIIRFIFLLLLAVSVFHNFLGAQPFEGFKFESDEDHNARLNSFKDIGNPLYEHYLPLFLDHGPRSHMVENIFDGTPGMDIRDLTPVVKQGKLPATPLAGLILLDLGLVPLVFVVLVFVVLFRRDKNKTLSKNRSALVITIFLVVLLAQFKTSALFYSNNWNGQGINETGRWLAVNGTIYYYSPVDETFMFNLTATSFKKTRAVDVVANGKPIGVYEISPQTVNIITDKIEAKSGENVLKLNSLDGCDVPYAENVSEDKRCLSVNILSMQKIFVENEELVIYAKNWYLPEENGRWMSGNSTIFIVRAKDEILSVSLYLAGYAETPVSMTLNGELIYSATLASHTTLVTLGELSFKRGVNEFRIIPAGGCEIPAMKENSIDTRCLSVFLGGLNVSRQ